MAPYWEEFSSYSPYEVEIEGSFSRVLLRSKYGERTVGAAVHGKAGALFFLPRLQYDKDKFLRTGEKEKGQKEDIQYWTKDAMRFGKRLVAALVGLAGTVSGAAQATPPPGWVMASNYRLAAENELEQKISKCLTEVAELQKKKSGLENELQAAGGLRGLLFEQGKPLESAVLEAMRLFGFDARPFASGESEFDGVFVSPEGRCLGEAEGKDNKPINIEKFSQLERNLNEDFSRDEVTEHAKGLMFGNAFRLKPVGERSEFFTDKCISAAKRIGAALIRTPDLFEPAKYLKEHPGDADYAANCREVIFAAKGTIVSFPEPPVAATTKLVEVTNSAETAEDASDEELNEPAA